MFCSKAGLDLILEAILHIRQIPANGYTPWVSFSCRLLSRNLVSNTPTDILHTGGLANAVCSCFSFPTMTEKAELVITG